MVQNLHNHKCREESRGVDEILIVECVNVEVFQGLVDDGQSSFWPQDTRVNEDLSRRDE